ncbi:hypothetical protein G9A89_023864 [Geosiphon pyriformis]|nr:hypothetical protein G9A89_023864 [Geosiphon pyriformis]
MTYIEKFNKLLRQIRQLKTNDYYSNAQILDQFIAGLKDKLIKKRAKRYEMAIEEANHIKLQLKTISPTNNNSNPKDINHSKDEIKITSNHSLITSLRIAITVEFLATGKEIAESYNETNKIGVINVTLHHSNLIINHYHQLTIYQDPNTKITIISPPYSQSNSNTNNHSHNIIKIAENANLLDIFSFEFEANESLFLLSNAAANKQKAITVIYTEAEVEEKAIRLILDSRSAGSIITYQLIQQLKKNVDRPAQTVIVTANSMKKTLIEEIDNFLFTLDGITIPVKVLIMDVPQYQALVGNDWLQKANAKLDWKTQELQLSYQGQHARVLTTCGTFNKRLEKAPVFKFEKEEEKPVVETFMAFESTFNWAEETEQTYFATKSYPEESKTPE